MKRFLFLLIVAALSAVFYLFPPLQGKPDTEIYEASAGQLLVPQKNVAIAVLDLKAANLSFVRGSDILSLRDLQADFAGLLGVNRVESILSVTRVISIGDDIAVSRAIPANDGMVSDEYMQKLASELADYPELSPYVNKDLDTLLFYVYFANKTPPASIHRGFKDLQAKWQDKLPFDFTGQGPIIAETENLITKDIAVFFPLLGLLVIGVYALFMSGKVVVRSIVLILASLGSAYGFVRFLGLSDSPLLLLVPVFGMGLLSDYTIHFYYHRFYRPESESDRSLRKELMFPLGLTALSTLTGFLSLSFINGSGHFQLGILTAAAVAVTWLGVFYWLDFGRDAIHAKPMMPGFQHAQASFFAWTARFRYVFYALIALATIWGAVQLPKLSIEPYPIGQLPKTNTIKRADTKINAQFYGSLPFFIEVDTGEKLSVLKKDTLIALDAMHREFEKENTGYAFSLLTVLKRMNFYFMGSEEGLLTSTEFDDTYDMLIEQYLLYYSSGVEPVDYESLLDNSYRLFSIKGLVYYHNYKDLEKFEALIGRLEAGLPAGWSLKVHGMVAQLDEERNNLRYNWIFSFIWGSALICLTVLLFYRKLDLALISLIPGIVSMIISFGVIGVLGISIDAFSIIYVSIITGLVIDYSIHTLAAIDQIKHVESLEDGFRQIMGYSGIPIFLSFLTSFLAFAVLFFSSFKGARSLAFLLSSSLVLSFFLSLYLLPLLVLPRRIKREKKNA